MTNAEEVMDALTHIGPGDHVDVAETDPEFNVLRWMPGYVVETYYRNGSNAAFRLSVMTAHGHYFQHPRFIRRHDES